MSDILSYILLLPIIKKQLIPVLINSYLWYVLLIAFIMFMIVLFSNKIFQKQLWLAIKIVYRILVLWLAKWLHRSDDKIKYHTTILETYKIDYVSFNMRSFFVELLWKVKWIILGLIYTWGAALIVNFLFWLLIPTQSICHVAISQDSMNHLSSLWRLSDNIILKNPKDIQYLLWFTWLYTLIVFLISSFFMLISLWWRQCLRISKLFAIVGVLIVIFGWLIQISIWCGL